MPVTKKKALPEYTQRGTKRKTSKQRSLAAKSAWERRFASGKTVKRQPRELLSAEERSEAARGAWVTRRKNLRKAERLAKKQAEERKAKRIAKRADKIVRPVVSNGNGATTAF